jgi:hypothetical protein
MQIIFGNPKIIRQYQWLGEGHFAVCKTVYTSSILVVASNPTSLTSQYYFIPCGFPWADWPIPEHAAAAGSFFISGR